MHLKETSEQQLGLLPFLLMAPAGLSKNQDALSSMQRLPVNLELSSSAYIKLCLLTMLLLCEGGHSVLSLCCT